MVPPKTVDYFDPRGSIEEIEHGNTLMPKFDKDGLIPCIAIEFKTGCILMFAFMNEEALIKTIQTGQAHYWSRSRSEIWKKGSTSGHVQKIMDIRVDCDQDAVCLIVQQAGGACHVGYKSCFYRSVERVEGANLKGIKLIKTEENKTFDPLTVYSNKD